MLTISLQSPQNFVPVQHEPPARRPGEALVRVHRVGVCGTDHHAHAGRQPFFEYPRVLGHELGVEVVEVDAGSALKVGDRCSVEPYLNCMRCSACRRGKFNCCSELRVLGVHIDGGMTSLLSLPTRKLHVSNSLTYDQLALVETLGIGAHAVERAAFSKEDTVLVVGAGPIGLSVLQFAQGAAAKVAVMDTNEKRLAFCRTQMGIAHTILAAGGDITAMIKEVFDGELPTVVFDATGSAASMQASFHLPAAGGKLVFVGLVQGDLTFNDPQFHRRELTLFASRNALPQTFTDIISAMETGRIDTRPWITHRLALQDVPSKFQQLTADTTLVKAMIEVP
jgi:2-desacetyl-2-hydroxyethyl bacteriochlorophyllide A dehydrogenase